MKIETVENPDEVYRNLDAKPCQKPKDTSIFSSIEGLDCISIWLKYKFSSRSTCLEAILMWREHVFHFLDIER